MEEAGHATTIVQGQTLDSVSVEKPGNSEWTIACQRKGKEVHMSAQHENASENAVPLTGEVRVDIEPIHVQEQLIDKEMQEQREERGDGIPFAV